MLSTRALGARTACGAGLQRLELSCELRKQSSVESVRDGRAPKQLRARRASLSRLKRATFSERSVAGSARSGRCRAARAEVCAPGACQVAQLCAKAEAHRHQAVGLTLRQEEGQLAQRLYEGVP